MDPLFVAVCFSRCAFCRYLKYLTKKFLKKNLLRDYLRVVAANKGQYDIRYYGVDNGEAEAAAE